MKRQKLAFVLFVVVLGAVGAACDGSVTITAVTPSHASTRGGDTITIAGSGFGTHPRVRFGTVDGVVQSATDTAIAVATPADVEGLVDVEVDVGAASAVLAHAITFVRYDMTFADTSWSSVDPIAVDGAGVVAIDVDGDGDLDIVQAAGTEGAWLYRNEGGAFPHATQIAAPDATSNVVGIVAADFDGNHSIDLLFATTGATPCALLLNDGKGTFTAKTLGWPALFGTSAQGIAIDYDGDGALDVVMVGASTTATGQPGIVVLANRGASFVDVTAKTLVGGSFPSTGVAGADVDNDGDIDLVFGASTEPCRLYVNDGHGVFQHGSVDALPSDALGAGVPAFGDLTGDGFVDLYIPSSAQDRILVNDGTGRFQDLTALRLGNESANGTSATIVDLDLDGHLDVLVVEQPGALRMYRNDGTGRLFDYSAQIAGADPSLVNAGIVLGDFDGDGDPDVFVSRSGVARAALFTNWAPRPMDDADGDGVPDSADSCPAIANSSQSNVDSLPFRCPSAASCKVATGCVLQVFRGSAYLVCSTAASWTAAEAACVARGAHLVTIDDADENAFVATHAPPAFWTGGNDVAAAGMWVWTGGDQTTYRNWAKSQPDDAGGVQRCIAVGAGGAWDDLACATAVPFVCEDVRARSPDPGDACDPCPNDYDPKDPALTSIADAGPDSADGATTKHDAGVCP